MFRTHFIHSFFVFQVTLWITILTISEPSYAQLMDRNSLSFDLEEDFKGQEIYSVGVNGFVISTKTEREQVRNFNEWKFHLFDTSFSQLYTKSQFISEHLISYRQFANDEFSHHCFLSTNGDFLLNTFTIENFNMETVKGTFPMKGTVVNMASSVQFAWFSYETKNGWFLIAIDWFTGQQKVIPIFINDVKAKKLRIVKIQIFEKDSEILLFLQSNKNQMVSTSFVMKLNLNGEFEYLAPLNLHDDENIISISALKLGQDNYVLTGTYSTNKVELLTKGLFFIKLENQKVKVKNYFDYKDFEGFRDYFIIDYKYGYHAAIHDLIPTDSGYIFFAEMYYPRYTLDVNNVPIYIGNSYTHAVICGFDTAGHEKWNRVEGIQLNKITTEKEGVIRILPAQDNRITFVYAAENYYVLNELDLNKLKVSNPDFLMINIRNPTMSDLWYNSNILSWYEDYFLFFSTQAKRIRVGGKSRKIEAIFLSKER